MFEDTPRTKHKDNVKEFFPHFQFCSLLIFVTVVREDEKEKKDVSEL